jgi:hypothetical protein
MIEKNKQDLKEAGPVVKDAADPVNSTRSHSDGEAEMGSDGRAAEKKADEAIEEKVPGTEETLGIP